MAEEKSFVPGQLVRIGAGQEKGHPVGVVIAPINKKEKQWDALQYAGDIESFTVMTWHFDYLVPTGKNISDFKSFEKAMEHLKKHSWKPRTKYPNAPG